MAYLQGDTSTSLVTDSDGRRVQVSYVCASYKPLEAKWTRDCNTVYNTAKPADGVLCLCSHNTSFAVLMVVQLLMDTCRRSSLISYKFQM